MKIEDLGNNKQFITILDKVLFKWKMNIKIYEVYKVRKYHIRFYYKGTQLISIYRNHPDGESIHQSLGSFISWYNINTTSAISL